MIIHVNDPSLIPDLLEYLTRNPDVVAARVGDDELEVSLLGSRRQPWNRMELTLRVRAWQAAREGVVVEIHAEA